MQEEKEKKRKRKVKQSTEHLVFFPVDNVWRKEKVEKLNLPVPEETSKDSDKTFSPLTLTAPSAFHHTKPDGNCFFNALSFVITGCEDHHFDIRQMICNHLISHEEELKLYLPTLCHGSAQKYLQKSCMRTNMIWATEVEIFVAAHMLNTNIYVYTKHGVNWKWLNIVPIILKLGIVFTSTIDIKTIMM